ncbi:MAG: 4a-hydroxytetrahydrobiopterin dehydratase [Chloroflexi bacterium]|nr:4a-hydroxytetrahydrobiopterin dehydratase [Chloroflexota bacterium]|tara:strand:+ start:520 stop:813 length:294 start_codon:yes stop_codon:yes gene_type:complete
MSKLEKKQILSKLSNLESWQLIIEDSIYKLQKNFNFEDFDQALKFTNKVGILSEENDHHPRIILEWGSVNITWWSHSEGGIVDSDFVMANKVDELKI